MNLKKIGLIALAVVALLVAGVLSTNDKSDGRELSVSTASISGIGKGAAIKAPNFKLTNADGEEVSLSDYKGKVIFLNFWATWCMPCRQEIPGFIKLQEKYKDDIVILGVSMDDNGPQVVPPFIEKFGINYPILYGTGRMVRDYGGIEGIPTTFVIDRELVIRKKYIGFRPDYIFERDIKEMI